MENNHSIAFSKDGQTWSAFLFNIKNVDGALTEKDVLDEVISDSFSDMNLQMANKGWIDLLNKNS